MLAIDKAELTQKYLEKNWNYVFDVAYKISDFILSQKYKIINEDIRQDMAQECCLNLYKKVLEGKINPDKNVFSFVWANSDFRIREILRKDRKRNAIASFISYDNIVEKVWEKEEKNEDENESIRV
jgi:hypothetical protein